MHFMHHGQKVLFNTPLREVLHIGPVEHNLAYYCSEGEQIAFTGKGISNGTKFTVDFMVEVQQDVSVQRGISNFGVNHDISTGFSQDLDAL